MDYGHTTWFKTNPCYVDLTNIDLTNLIFGAAVPVLILHYILLRASPPACSMFKQCLPACCKRYFKFAKYSTYWQNIAVRCSAIFPGTCTPRITLQASLL